MKDLVRSITDGVFESAPSPLASLEGHRAEVDELRRQIAEVVVVVDGLPRAGQRPREHVAGENLEERVLVAEPVGEAGVGVIQALEE